MFSKKKQIGILLAIICLMPVAYVVAQSLLATIRGGQVQIVGLSGGVAYSLDDITWTTLGDGLSNVPYGTTLYARVETTQAGYTGAVTVTWTLFKDGVEVHTLTDYTSFTLTGATGDLIHCSPDGTATGALFDWSTVITEFGNYEVEARFYTA